MTGKITKYGQLQDIGCVVERAKPFIKVDGKRQSMIAEFC